MTPTGHQVLLHTDDFSVVAGVFEVQAALLTLSQSDERTPASGASAAQAITELANDPRTLPRITHRDAFK